MPLHPLVQQFKNTFSQEPELEKHLFNPSATEIEITEFQQKIGLPLSDVFYDFYRCYNGSRYVPKDYDYDCIIFHEGAYILSLSQILDEKELWDSLEDDDVFKEYEPGTWWNKAWIPFMHIRAWHLTVIDTRGCFQGVAGQILSFDYKSADGKVMKYKSFEKWLETMLELKKAGLLLYAENKDYEPTYDYLEQDKQAQNIYERINIDFFSLVDIWNYRRKEKPYNPAFETLTQAIENHDLETVQSLLKSKQIDLNETNPYQLENYSPLLMAIAYKAFPIALFLIEQGANILEKDIYGGDAFRNIVSKLSYLDDAKPAIQVLDKLIEKSYNFNCKTDHWDDPLHFLLEEAVRENNLELMEYSLQKGANINKIVPHANGNSFLHEALKSESMRYETIVAMVNFGADKTLRNDDGETPLDIFYRRWAGNMFLTEEIRSSYGFTRFVDILS
jgi:cell wall assembly regulator SMI1